MSKEDNVQIASRLTEFRKYLRRFYLRRGLQHDDTEDLSQQVLFSLITKYAHVIDYTSQIKLLHTLAVNALIDLSRSSLHRYEVVGDMDQISSLPDETENIERHTEFQAFIEAMEQRLSELDETGKLLEVFRLRFKQNYGLVEIGQSLKISPATVYNWIAKRIIPTLQVLKEEWH